MPQTVIHLFKDDDGSVPFTEWLNEMAGHDQKTHAKCMAAVLKLESLGNELRRPNADILRDGIYELRFKRGRVNFRVLYFFYGQHAVVLSHVITKKAKVPPGEIDTAVLRKSLVEKDPDKYIQ